MLLTRLPGALLHVKRPILFAVIGFTVSAQPQPQPACFVDLPVFDAKGDRQFDFEIVSVALDGNSNIDLLEATDLTYRVRASSSRIYFPLALIGKRRIEVTLQNKSAVKIVRRVPLMSCQQRTSIRHGMSDTGAEVSTTTVKGRIVGCALDSSWWIQAFPMFGASETPVVHEGFVRYSDGEFLITSGFNGERHLLIVGKDKEPVMVLGIDIVRGGKNEVGNVNLRGPCPVSMK